MIVMAIENTACTAMVLTDPPDTKSLMARCCKIPAVWAVHPGGKYGVGLSGAACASHVNLLLQEVAQVEVS